MACTFPTYSDITGAQIIAVVAPRTSLGSYDVDAIDFDKTSNTTNSIIGLCVQEFNDWFDDISVTIADVSADDCSKITLALKLYIAGKYLESDKKLTSSDGDFYPYQDVKHLFDRACELIQETEANISGVAAFCSYGKDTIAENWDSEGFTKYKPDLEENFSRGLPPKEQKARHIDLLGLLEDHHTQYLTNTRGDVRYYTKSQVDGLLDGLVSDHGELTGLADDDHPQYHNDTRGDARYYTQTYIDANFAALSHTHDDRYYTETEINGFLSGKSDTGHTHAWGEITSKPTFGAVATSNNYNDLDNLPTLFSGNYGDLSGAPDLTQYLQSVAAGTNITVDNTDPQNPIISSSGGGANPAGSDNDIQYKNGTSLGATTGFSFDGSNLTIPTGGAYQLNSQDLLSYDSTNDTLLLGFNTNIFGAMTSGIAIGPNAGEISYSDGAIYIGNKAGSSSTGQAGIAIGDKALGAQGNTGATGFANIAIGASSLTRIESGAQNISIGGTSGHEMTLGTDNTIIGYSALYNATTQSNNTIIGKSAAFSLLASECIFIGKDAGAGSVNNLTGQQNTVIGTGAGLDINAAEQTVLIGYETQIVDNAGYNTILGYQAGRNSATDSSVFIGYRAGRDEADSNKLIIGNNETSKLIEGHFTQEWVKVTGSIETTDHLILAEITTPTAVADKGKLYTKSDNKLYFQDGAGTEHEIQFV